MSRPSILFHYLLILQCWATSLDAQVNTLRPEIRRLLIELRKDKEVHLGYPVGIAAVPETNNKYYKHYCQLKEKATDKELLILTDDTCKEIVIYAFDILYSRKNSTLKTIFLKHQNDTRSFWIASGCTGIADRVNLFMLDLLDPNRQNVEPGYMTKKEFDSFRKKLAATHTSNP